MDVLSAALGAVIFLFIITPKGGQLPSIFPPIAMSIDTLHRQVFGSLGDEFYRQNAGDTLLVVIKGYEDQPSLADCPVCPTPIECPECPPPIKCPEPTVIEAPLAINTPATSITNDEGVETKPPGVPPIVSTPKPIEELPNPPKEANPTHSGDSPNVPCSVSFEISWEKLKDNVDFFVCKGSACVYGKRWKRKHPQIGQWDSGKAKTTTWGSDLRTTQEAVRQFNGITPGKYELYAQFKKSEQKKGSVNIKGLIYSKNNKNVEQGESFYDLLILNEKKRTHIGTVVLQENGKFIFTKK